MSSSSSSSNSQTQNNNMKNGMPVSGGGVHASRRDDHVRELKKLLDRGDAAAIVKKGLAMKVAEAARGILTIVIRAATVNADNKSDGKVNTITFATPSPSSSPQGLQAKYPTPARANPKIKFVGRATNWHGPGVEDLRKTLKEERGLLLACERKRQREEERDAAEWEMVENDGEEEWIKV
ncbi:hypothetical protein M430DRAFT_59282 [Amorphotheca resinae ATCC 22711]|uniref:Uncharacterized protein n=1 Tax=Amorphotheca resinae ATCC 22711 TaxID=857342 RepID=A0A2T3B0I6_AMORE|nr:hypothetical protein M430DRAFT_59282 [Amorphotheca resinae ATCC 22711]PSS16883.1 hypothetical protein M430DRAFT_59282 [Amorphotheca resinae ATCC 22711]